MDAQNWLDIHGHFSTPLASEEACRTLVETLRKNDFLVDEAPRFDAEGTIAYLNRAGVALQMLSYIPWSIEKLRAANDYGASIVAKHPSRFGLLTALPTNDPQACLEEIDRTTKNYAVPPDGFAASTVYNDVR